MRILKILILTLILGQALFAVNDLNGLSHNIVRKDYQGELGFVDLKGYESLTPRDSGKTRRINGDIEVIGATISVPKNGGFDYEPSRRDIYVSSLTDVRFLKENPKYQTNSSYAKFNFSKPKNQNGQEVAVDIKAKDVVFARLYWAGGMSSSGWQGNPNQANLTTTFFNLIKDFNKIKFGTPDGKYYDFTASQTDTRWYGSFTRKGMQFMYHTSYDVTTIIQSMGDLVLNNATFSAGNIKSSEGQPGGIRMFRDGDWLGEYNGYAFSGHYGGWSLVVVYDLKDDTKAKAKNVTVFDGLYILAPIHNIGVKETKVKFDGFYTPSNGDIKSSLTVLAFGAKKEVNSENIMIKKGSRYEVVTSANNPAGGQFNSTITKFGNYVDSNKKYNNQMDLDTYDISNHITNRQYEAEVALQANVIQNGVTTLGDRANISFVAFSTDVYIPHVCYDEKLLLQSKDGGGFKELAKKGSGAPTPAKEGDTLRSQVTILNQGNETAENISISTNISDKTGTYSPNSTYVKPYASGGFSISASDKVNDNSGLQKHIGKDLQFFVGQNASSGSGGNLAKNNKAFIQYDLTLKNKFEETGYLAKFSNKSIKLEYNGAIKKCEQVEYALKIIKDQNPHDFIPTTVADPKDTDKLSIYTQLANKPFDLNIVHTKGGKIAQAEDDVELDVKIVDQCTSDESLIAGAAPTRKATFTSTQSVAKIKDITIEKPYTSLHVKLYYTDPINHKVKTSCESYDPFAVRPKEFKLYDTQKKTASLPLSLTGGLGYKNVGLIATDAKNQPAKGYTSLLETSGNNIVSFLPELPSTCVISESLKKELVSNLLKAEFTNSNTAVGSLKRNIKGAARASDDSFYYPDIGDAKLIVIDGSYTAVDQANGDCIAGSDTATKDTSGKIGCNIALKTPTFKFLPKDLLISDFKISDFGNNMTYLSNSADMAAAASFDLTARLGNDKTARLYSKGCYSKNAKFTISTDKIIKDYTDNKSAALTDDDNGKKRLNDEILFFSDNISAAKKSAGVAANDGSYEVLADGFKDGTSKNRILFNFARLTNLAKNPFKATSDIFNFQNIYDTDGVKGATYTKPAAANLTSAKFYYGRVYAPYYEGPKSGFDADVYYGVYCDNCSADYVPTGYGSSWEKMPSTTSWYVNPLHDTNKGYVSKYESAASSNITRINSAPSATVPTITSGKESVNLRNTRATMDLIKMTAPQWLIHDAFDEKATTSDFNVKFIDKGKWAGKALRPDGKQDNVGEIIGGSDLKNLDDKTNRRIEW
ncbi:hypothetical protein [Campylobacter curvus]|uniref:hypothetical protein n=1 Tax=Campylobacter curvus TaxID=200 RepID=UPI001470442E|nr:hypothetical protein [Campylobacter curvus]